MTAVIHCCRVPQAEDKCRRRSCDCHKVHKPIELPLGTLKKPQGGVPDLPPQDPPAPEKPDWEPPKVAEAQEDDAAERNDTEAGLPPF